MKRKKPSQAAMKRLWKYVVGEIDRLQVSGEDCAQQSDEVHINGAEFVGKCGAIVGFWKYPEED